LNSLEFLAILGERKSIHLIGALPQAETDCRIYSLIVNWEQRDDSWEKITALKTDEPGVLGVGQRTCSIRFEVNLLDRTTFMI
jgi:hypothetical protein